jgi:hypothetical protein
VEAGQLAPVQEAQALDRGFTRDPWCQRAEGIRLIGLFRVFPVNNTLSKSYFEYKITGTSIPVYFVSFWSSYKESS